MSDIKPGLQAKASNILNYLRSTCELEEALDCLIITYCGVLHLLKCQEADLDQFLAEFTNNLKAAFPHTILDNPNKETLQ